MSLHKSAQNAQPDTDTRIDELKKNAQVRKFMAKYRYQYHNTMLNDLATLIAEQVAAARIEELEKLIDKTEWPDPYNWYVKWGEIKDRIAELKEGQK